MFAERIVGHPFKYESHRLGAENSEDALSRNVFRSLQEAGCLLHWEFDPEEGTPPERVHYSVDAGRVDLKPKRSWKTGELAEKGLLPAR